MNVPCASIALGIAAAALVLPTGPAPAAEPAERFDAIVRSIRAEREKIQSGVVHITGSEGVDDPRKPDRSESDAFKIDVAFDADHLRFDTQEMGYVKNADTGQLERARIERKYLRRKDKIGTWASGQRSPVDEPNRPPIGRGELFDVRVMDIRGWTGRYMSLDDTFEALLHHPWAKSVDDSNPKSLVLALFGGNPMRNASDYRIWVSPGEGYTVSRTELQARPRPEAAWEVWQQSDTEWQAAGGTRVPARHKWSKYLLGKRQFVDLELDWEQVNEPVDPKWFDIEALGGDATVESLNEAGT